MPDYGYRCPLCNGGFHAALERCPWCYQPLSEKQINRARRYAQELPIWMGTQIPLGKTQRRVKAGGKPKKRGPQTTLPLRTRVYERDGYQCAFCGSSANLTLDHVIPRSRGGKHTMDNLQTACVGCNNLKAAWLEGEDGWPSGLRRRTANPVGGNGRLAGSNPAPSAEARA